MSLLFEQTIRLSQIARAKPIIIVHEDVDCLYGTNEERKKTHLGFTQLNWFRDGQGGKKLTLPVALRGQGSSYRSEPKDQKREKSTSEQVTPPLLVRIVSMSLVPPEDTESSLRLATAQSGRWSRVSLGGARDLITKHYRKRAGGGPCSPTFVAEWKEEHSPRSFGLSLPIFCRLLLLSKELFPN